MTLIGTVIAFAGSEDKIPSADGWLPCDGRALRRAGEYAQLFSIIGTLHGVGDGVNTFNIPDFRGYFLRGVTGSSGTDKGLNKRVPIAGNRVNEAGSQQSAATAMPATLFTTSLDGGHYHQDPTPNGQSGPYELAAPGGISGHDYGRESAPTTSVDHHSHTVTGGGDEETRPINKYVHWLIKAK